MSFYTANLCRTFLVNVLHLTCLIRFFSPFPPPLFVFVNFVRLGKFPETFPLVVSNYC